MRVRKANFLGRTASQSEALALCRHPADLVLVDRGAPRSIVMKCPDGCGETLTVNLDSRTGKAWRFYQRRDGISLYPSVWRTTGCRSHFIVWDDAIYWSDGSDGALAASDPGLRCRVLERLSRDSFAAAELIAEELQEVPWAVLRVCRGLVGEGQAVEGRNDLEGRFRLTARS